MSEMGVPMATLAATCFHCGLSVPANTHWNTTIEDVSRPMCCPGCQAVAQSIVDNGFGDYYRTRMGYSASGDQKNVVPPEYALYDTVEQAGQFGSQVDIGEATFTIDGLRCAACVWLIERRLARLAGIIRVDMNVATGRLSAQWRRNECKPSDILKTLRDIGYAAYPFDAMVQSEQLERARKKLFRRLFIAGLSMMQVMMYALPVYMASDGTMDSDMTNLMRWASLLLTVPAIGYSAQPFFLGAWINLKNRMLGMDVPVALGLGAAFFGSVWAMWCGQGDVYFDSITMFIFLLLCSRYLELGARRKAASALDSLQHALPASAWRFLTYPLASETELVAASSLVSGDTILVKPGEVVPADGVIVDGNTTLDFSLLTGESQAIQRTVGANVPGGAVNVTQSIALRVTQSLRDSTLSVLMRLVERAGQGKPQIAMWADSVAAWFVAALLVFSVIVFVVWQYVDPSRAWAITVAVLVVSCPCALSLATPTVLASATNRLLRQGVLVVGSSVLETLHHATHIIFDKTGTLTVGRPVLKCIETRSDLSSASCLSLAGVLAAGSNHPLSQALVRAALADGVPQGSYQSLWHSVGQGLEGQVDGKRYRLGSLVFTQELVGHDGGFQSAPDLISIYLSTDNAFLARFDLTDQLRSDADHIVRYFQKKGKEVILLSGDSCLLSERVAKDVGITTAIGQCLPDEKLRYVQNLQREGSVVAMVGDGINDAAVLSAADVSFAMGDGSALAQTRADCVLMSGQLSSLVVLNETATKAFVVIRQNLFWAVIYNLIAIPAAAFGFLNPWMSGIGMSLSSILVILNALRLQFQQKKPTMI